MRRLFALLLMALACAALDAPLGAEEDRASEGEKLFALHVKSLLAQKCLACHGAEPAKIESELDLTTREGMLRGGLSGLVALKPGDAAGSLLYTAVVGESAD